MAESSRLEKLEQQRARLSLQIAKEKEKLKHADRKRDTRRKVLAGALVLKELENSPNTPFALKLLKLFESLKRDDERALFGLKPLPESAADNSAIKKDWKASNDARDLKQG